MLYKLLSIHSKYLLSIGLLGFYGKKNIFHLNLYMNIYNHYTVPYLYINSLNYEDEIWEARKELLESLGVAIHNKYVPIS